MDGLSEGVCNRAVPSVCSEHSSGIQHFQAALYLQVAVFTILYEVEDSVPSCGFLLLLELHLLLMDLGADAFIFTFRELVDQRVEVVIDDIAHGCAFVFLQCITPSAVQPDTDFSTVHRAAPPFQRSVSQWASGQAAWAVPLRWVWVLFCSR